MSIWADSKARDGWKRQEEEAMTALMTNPFITGVTLDVD
jgi:hypothetical protein